MKRFTFGALQTMPTSSSALFGSGFPLAQMSAPGPKARLGSPQKWSADRGRPEVGRRQRNRRCWPECMVRPRVARGFVNLADAVLHQCIRPLIGACCAPGHHGYQRAFQLISGQASNGPFGSPVFACAGKTDPPSLSHSSRRPRRVRDVGYVIDRTSLRAVPWFVPGCRSFVPACARRRAARKGRQGRPSCCPDVLLYRGQAAP